MRLLGSVLIFTAVFIGYLFFTGQVMLYYVVTGSMEPSIPVDSLVVAVQDKTISAGDVAVYRLGESMLLHRVKEVLPQAAVFSADADPGYEELVELDRVVGRVMLAIPLLGYFYMIPTLAIAGLIVVLSITGKGMQVGFWTTASSVLAMAILGEGGLTIIGKPLAIILVTALTAVSRIAEARMPEEKKWIDIAYTCIFLVCILSVFPSGLRRLTMT